MPSAQPPIDPKRHGRPPHDAPILRSLTHQAVQQVMAHAGALPPDDFRHSMPPSFFEHLAASIAGRTHEVAYMQLSPVVAETKSVVAVPVYRIYWLSQADSDQVLAE